MKAELKRFVKNMAPYGIISKESLKLQSQLEEADLCNMDNVPEP